MANSVLNGVMGLCVADAVGVPVEFIAREKLSMNPVTDMRGFGSHAQPAGTWSDDTSLTLCLVDSLSHGLNYDDIMARFCLWVDCKGYTPHGSVFDIGRTTLKAIGRYKKGIAPLQCGGNAENDNGNGSLMRILPIVFHIQSHFGIDDDDESIFEIIHDVSSLTHAHRRCLIACGTYCCIALSILSGNDLNTSVDIGIKRAFKHYTKDEAFALDLQLYQSLQQSISELPPEQIKSGGYVVDTLMAAMWCLLTTRNYKDCVLKAVNLGSDTDTVAAVAGGLAGLYYGYESIPKDWIMAIARREYIENLCNQLNERVVG